MPTKLQISASARHVPVGEGCIATSHAARARSRAPVHLGDDPGGGDPVYHRRSRCRRSISRRSSARSTGAQRLSAHAGRRGRAARGRRRQVRQSLGEPLFELPLSGWYWQVARLDGGKPRSARLALALGPRLPKLEEQGVPLRDRVRERLCRGPGGSAAARGRAAGRFRRRTGASSSRSRATRPRSSTRRAPSICALSSTFVALTFGLLLSTLFQVRFGLAPLKRITGGLAAIRSGTPSGWRANFPVEIAPLARETNALLDANREIVERARTHVGNLAHALKTPLSVIVNEAEARGNEPFAAEGARAGRHHARSGRAPSRARAHRRAADRGRHAHRHRAGDRRRCTHHGENPPRQGHRDRGAMRRAARNSAASGRISRR